MKKLLLLAALFVGTLTASAIDSNYITGKLTVDDDLDGATLSVNLTNATSYVAFQMDIAFPEDYTITASADGITYTRADAKGTVTINGSEQTSAFTLAYNVLSDNHTIRLVAYNLGNVAIAGESGDELLTVYLTADATDQGCAEADEWTATFSNVIFVTSDDLAEEQLYLNGDSSASQTVTGETGRNRYDLDDNGVVNAFDLRMWVNYFNNTYDEDDEDTYDSLYDFNDDGVINVFDLRVWVNYYNNEYEED